MNNQDRKFHAKPFRICLSQKERELLLNILFREVSFAKKNQQKGAMLLQKKQYYKASLSLIRLYSKPTLKDRKMYEHTIESLDVLLGMMEVYLYDTLKDDFSKKLYDRLSRTYQKRQKQLLSTTAER